MDSEDTDTINTHFYSTDVEYDLHVIRSRWTRMRMLRKGLNNSSMPMDSDQDSVQTLDYDSGDQIVFISIRHAKIQRKWRSY